MIYARCFKRQLTFNVFEIIISELFDDLIIVS